MILVPYFLLVFMSTCRQLPTFSPKRGPISPIEKLLGLLSGLTFLSEVYFKGANYSLVYMLNPCHVLLLTQTLLFLLPRSKLTSFLYALSLGMTFCPWIALVFR